MAQTNTEPYTIHLISSNHSLGHITGLTYRSISTSTPQCHYFGGIPYALPPIGPFRFRRPRPLPSCHRYGTQRNPGNFTSSCGICPQVKSMPPSGDDSCDAASWDEDCLQLNIWVPAGKPPKGGWPVLFYIHGGWLQLGSPNGISAAALLGENEFQCIVVCPAYRLNVFGFLASAELLGEGAVPNCGFWDQRMALEWTWKKISYFGGNSACITVGGYSAGSHSTFHQLAYDLRQVSEKRIIKRAIMFSNGPGLQPKHVHSPVIQEQFDQLLLALLIPNDLPPDQKLDLLRSCPSKCLVQGAALSIPLHEFRAVTDGAFVSPTLFDEIENGTFANRMKESGVELLIGECKDEHHIYGAYRPPKENTFEAMRLRLCADYQPSVVDALLHRIYCPPTSTPNPSNPRPLPTFRGKQCTTWSEASGHIFSEMQVHCIERGFIAKLHEHGAGHLVRRYRIEWRAKCIDRDIPREWGVTHGTDLAIWFWMGLEEGEKEVVRGWLKPLWGWVGGKDFGGKWGEGPKTARRLKGNGTVDEWDDEFWQRGLRVWEVARAAGLPGVAARF